MDGSSRDPEGTKRHPASRKHPGSDRPPRTYPEALRTRPTRHQEALRKHPAALGGTQEAPRRLADSIQKAPRGIQGAQKTAGGPGHKK